MGGATPAGLPNGHHPMPPHQPGSMGQDDQQQVSSQPTDPNSDSYHQQMSGGQYNNQQQMKYVFAVSLQRLLHFIACL